MITTDYVIGSPCWVELTTSDVDAAAEFYRRVFGWEAVSAGPETGGYMLLRSEGETVGGLGPKMAQDQPVAWSIYFNTLDVDASVQRAKELGATVYVEPMEVMDLGRMAYLGDPQGGAVSLWQAGTLPGMERTDEPNTFMWAELWTPSQQGAKDFYEGLFSWEFNDVELPGGGGTYSTIRPAGLGEDRYFGGMTVTEPTQLPQTAGRADWHPVFQVADCDASATAVRRAGGQVRTGPVDMPGAGRMAVCFDPSSAVFVLLDPGTGRD